LLGRKQSRKNHYKQRSGKKPIRISSVRLRLFFKAVSGVILVGLMSIMFIFSYDLITQCNYFKAKSLTVAGNNRLSDKEIISQAHIKKGINIFSANFSLVRKRLLEHPWIAEAKVSRELPSGINIKVKEHKPLAIIDLGRRFLINDNGEIFKEWRAADPEDLPVITGLKYSDIHISVPSGSDKRYREITGIDGQWCNTIFAAVMDVLHLGKSAESILPNREIRQIQVDREIGLTVYAFNKVKAIRLGYDNYQGKYDLLKKVLLYIKKIKDFQDYISIDLYNFNRIVVNPVRRE